MTKNTISIYNDILATYPCSALIWSNSIYSLFLELFQSTITLNSRKQLKLRKEHNDNLQMHHRLNYRITVSRSTNNLDQGHVNLLSWRQGSVPASIMLHSIYIMQFAFSYFLFIKYVIIEILVWKDCKE